MSPAHPVSAHARPGGRRVEEGRAKSRMPRCDLERGPPRADQARGKPAPPREPGASESGASVRRAPRVKLTPRSRAASPRPSKVASPQQLCGYLLKLHRLEPCVRKVGPHCTASDFETRDAIGETVGPVPSSAILSMNAARASCGHARLLDVGLSGLRGFEVQIQPTAALTPRLASSAWSWLTIRPVAAPAPDFSACLSGSDHRSHERCHGPARHRAEDPSSLVIPLETRSRVGRPRAARQSMARRLADDLVNTCCPLRSTADPGISHGWGDGARGPSSKTCEWYADEQSLSSLRRTVPGVTALGLARFEGERSFN